MTTPPEEVELEEIIEAFKNYIVECTNLIPSSVKQRKINYSQAKQALLRWREAYADKARIDELETILLVFDTKCENCKENADEIEDRISALRKQQDGLERRSDGLI